MDLSKTKGKEGLISKAWERCKSFGGGGDGNRSSTIKRCFLKKIIKSKMGKTLVAPIGCFSVYVGPQRERFVIKTEHANHPLFKALLEEAEFEYGYKSEGPLELPCDVDDFLKVLLEMEECDDDNMFNHQGCTFGTKGYRYASSRHLTPCKIIAINNF